MMAACALYHCKPGCTAGMHPLAPEHNYNIAKTLAEAWAILFEKVHGPVLACGFTQLRAQYMVSLEKLLG